MYNSLFHSLKWEKFFIWSFMAFNLIICVSSINPCRPWNENLTNGCLNCLIWVGQRSSEQDNLVVTGDEKMHWYMIVLVYPFWIEIKSPAEINHIALKLILSSFSIQITSSFASFIKQNFFLLKSLMKKRRKMLFQVSFIS